MIYTVGHPLYLIQLVSFRASFIKYNGWRTVREGNTSLKRDMCQKIPKFCKHPLNDHCPLVNNASFLCPLGGIDKVGYHLQQISFYLRKI